MDWDKVIAQLRAISNQKYAEANEWSMRSGYHEAVKQARTIGDVMGCLAAALSAGRD